MARKPRAPKPDLTKEQLRFLAKARASSGGCVYLDKSGDRPSYRLNSGLVINAQMLHQLIKKGVLYPVSFDLIGEAQQWAIR
jgi:hypothetical protein